jgi:metal transporter CNNM
LYRYTAIRDHMKLSEAETNAITAFLSLNVAEFKKLARFGGGAVCKL